MAKVLLKRTRVHLRLRGEKGLERLRGLVPELPRALRTLAHEVVIAEDGLTLWPSWSRRRLVRAIVFSPAVHPRAIRSGHERYAADSHGHSKATGELGPAP